MLNEPLYTEILLSILLGIGLSAATGFRIFVPFTVMSLASITGHIQLAPGWEWIGSYPALLAFAVATVLEILAYYVPWLDNLLDTVAAPAAIVAGIVATASVVTGMSPLLTWTLAIIAGGGIAGLVQSATTMMRATSSMATLGAANPLVSTGELLGSVVTTILALLLPVGSLLIIFLAIVWLIRAISKKRASNRNTVIAKQSSY
jgi:hypothetical protein